MNSDLKILIVEDESPIRRFLEVLTTGHGYQVKSAACAQEGLRYIATWQPNLILLDLGLPDLDGLDLTRELRTWTDTPIIVISARDKETDKVLMMGTRTCSEKKVLIKTSLLINMSIKTR